jgi:hypothetical protein
VGYKEAVKHATTFAALTATVLLASAAGATPRATPAQRHESPGVPATPPEWEVLDVTQSQATAQIAKIAAWDVTMQSTSCPDPDAGVWKYLDAGDAGPLLACSTGGIIEVQSGPGMAIIQSDNTQEAIGVWSENQKLNHVSHVANITLGFDFLATHPGYDVWEITNDPGPDYYSVYNCGWGVRAVILYEAETGDMSHHAYGATCASHIVANAANIISFGDLLDVGPAAWAASGLWAWGNAYGDASMKMTAASIGGQVKAWIQAKPSRISSQEWAMTGAAPFYGVIESYMKENPSELVPWVTEYSPGLGGWIDESVAFSLEASVASGDYGTNDWTDWRNAHNAWNMLGHFTTAQVLGAKAGKPNQVIATDILNKLVAQANPMTGAIAGSQQRPSTEAESWITAYMVYFGLLQVIAESPSADAGVEAGVKDAGGHPPKDASAPRDAAADASTGGTGGGGCGLVESGGESAAPLGVLVALLAVAARRRSKLARR